MLQCNSKTKKCAISGSSSSYTELVKGPTQRIKLKIIFTYLPSYLHFFQNNFRGRVHSLCMDFKTFLFLLVCIIMSVIVESYMSTYLLLLPLEGSLFSNLIGLMVGRKKIKMATYTTAASDPVCQCIEQNKSF